MVRKINKFLQMIVAAGILMSATQLKAAENNGISVTKNGLSFTIKCDDASAGTEIHYRTLDGSAIGGVHYEQVDGVVKLAQGESKTIDVTPKQPTGLDAYGNANREFVFVAWNESSSAEAKGSIKNTYENVVSFEEVSQTLFSGETSWIKAGKKDYKFSTQNLKATDDANNEFKKFKEEYAYFNAIGQDFQYKFKYYVRGYKDKYGGYQVWSIYQDGGKPDIFRVDLNLLNKYYEKYFEITLPTASLPLSGKADNPYYNTDFCSKNGVEETKEGYFTFSSNTEYIKTYFGADDRGGTTSDGDYDIRTLIAYVKLHDYIAPKAKSLAITEKTYNVGEKMTIAVVFDELVNAEGVTKAVTDRGDFAYAGGSGTNVLYFTGKADHNGQDKGIKVMSIDGTVADLYGNKWTFAELSNSAVTINPSAAVYNTNTYIFEISNLAQLVWFRDQINKATDDDNKAKNAVLMADIDATIACYNGGWEPFKEYLGTFDGNGHTISGLNITNDDNVGLFATVGSESRKAVIRDLTVEGNVTGNNNVGGLAGTIANAEISNCKVNAIVNGQTNVGGLAGHVVSATISNVENKGMVIGYGSKPQYIGGICGLADNATITNAVNNGGIIVDANYNANNLDVYCGGICGKIASGTISGCSNNDNVGYSVESMKKMETEENPTITPISYAGGIAGYTGENVTVDNCKATASNNSLMITAFYYAGGIVGYNGGSVKNSDAGITVMAFYEYAGGIAGYNNGTVDGCHYSISNGTCSAFLNYTGGIAGYNGDKGTISNCYSKESMITGEGKNGGIAGYNKGEISICYSENNEISGKEGIGGIAGYNDGGTISNCYNTSAVEDESSKNGGIAGYNKGTISNCFNNGTISGKTNVGGIAGQNDGGTISNCYYLNGCATDEKNFPQNGVGNNVSSNATTDVDGNTNSATEDEINKGKICYLLNNSIKDGIWRQDISNANSYPCFNGPTVNYNGSAYVNPAFEKVEKGNLTPNKSTYYQGDPIDLTGITLIEKYNDNTTVTIDAQDALKKHLLTVTGYDSTKYGDQTIGVIYRGTSFSNITTVIVNQLFVKAMEVTNCKNEYNVNDELDLTDGELMVTFNSGNIRTIALDNSRIEVSGFNSAKGGVITLNIKYTDKFAPADSINYNVNIVKAVESIKAENYKTIYAKGDDFGYEFGHLVVTYNDGTTDTLSFDAEGITFGNFDTETTGEGKAAFVYYSEKMCTINYNVVAQKSVANITVVNPATIYYVGDEFNYEAGLLHVEYNNLTTEDLKLDDAGVTVSGFNSARAIDDKELTVSFGGKTCTYTVDILEIEIESISLQGAQTEIEINQRLDREIGQLMIIYNNGDIDSLPFSNNRINVFEYDNTKLADSLEITLFYSGMYAKHYADIICHHNDTIVENSDIVAATCTVAGSHTETGKCRICGTQLFSNRIIDAALGHKPAEAVKENNVVNGNKTSYDMVVYCSVDSVELHRHTFEVTSANTDTVYVNKIVKDTVIQTVLDTIYVTDTVYVTDTIYVTDTVYINNNGDDDNITIDRAKAMIKAYPNPVKQILYVNFDEYVDIEMFNEQGSMVYKSQFSTDSHQVNVVDFPDGAYVVKASNGSICRVIVQ